MKQITYTELANMGIDLRDIDSRSGRSPAWERQWCCDRPCGVLRARVLILDEPTAALGVKQSGVVLKYIARARDRGLGVVFITHNPHHAYPVGDRFLLLNRGTSIGNFEKTGDLARAAHQHDGRRGRAGTPLPTSWNARSARGSPVVQEMLREAQDVDALDVVEPGPSAP